jgi:hypothetical protein
MGLVVSIWHGLRNWMTALFRRRRRAYRPPTTWRARLRFRLRNKLAIEASEHRLQVAGREVVLAPPTPDLKIADSPWLIMNTRGFASADEAREFGSN